jgi:hypothetical protein
LAQPTKIYRCNGAIGRRYSSDQPNHVEWGSGKSTVLYHLKKELEKKCDNVVITFEAWRYEQEDSLLPSLIRCIWQAKGKPKGSLGQMFNNAVLTAAVLIPWALPLLGAGVDVFCKGMTITKLKQDLETAKQETGFEPAQCLTDQLCEQFYQLLNKSFHKKHVTILIDDLDRCNPESALQLLDNIRMLINWLTHHQSSTVVGQVRFLVAMDQVSIKEIVAKKFQDMGHYDVNRYLEKLFPFAFKLPEVGEQDMAEFLSFKITQLEINLKPMERVFTFYQEHLTDSILYQSFKNPRLIKRSLNKIAVLSRLAVPTPEFLLNPKGSFISKA